MSKNKYTNPDLPVYEIYVDEEDQSGINFISLVKSPATESIGYAFNEQSNYTSFKKIDEQKIFGYFMVPDKLIFRSDKKNGDYYVKFSKDTIKNMMMKFNKYNNNKSLNINHTNDMAPGFISENWICESEFYDKSKLFGYDPIVGGWCGIVKIEDSKFWKDKVRGEDLYSFSVEGLMNQKPATYCKQEHFNKIKNINELIEWLSDEDKITDEDLNSLIKEFNITK
jgi:hypothetical protein